MFTLEPPRVRVYGIVILFDGHDTPMAHMAAGEAR